MQVNTYSFFYRDERSGSHHIGYIQGTDNHSAYRQAKAMYGTRMLSEMVTLIPPGMTGSIR